MTPKEFNGLLRRDHYRCWHCGKSGDDLVPQHRIGRGMGGSKLRNGKSNLLVFCSLANGLIESDANLAQEARAYGWKLPSWVDPLYEPAYDVFSGSWYLLDNDGNRTLFYKEVKPL